MRGTHIVARIPGFYAALEKELNPELRNRPVLVSIGTGFRAVVLSVCELAAQRGVMPGQRLGDIDISGIEVIPASAGKYEDGTARTLATLASELPDVRCLRPGVFAAFWGGGNSYLSPAMKKAREGMQALGHQAAWGLSQELASAEIASIVARPGGMVVVPQGEERTFLAPLPTGLIPDLNPGQIALLQEIGVHTIGDITDLPSSALRRMFGPEGPLLLEIAKTGRRPTLKPQWRKIRKLGEDAENPLVLYQALAELVAEGIDNIHSLGRRPGRLTLTLVYADRKRTTGQIKPGKNLHEGKWQHEVHKLAEELWKRRVRIGEIRLSIVYELDPEYRQLQLFETLTHSQNDDRLSDAVFMIRQRWGTATIRFASAAFVRGNPFRGAIQP